MGSNPPGTVPHGARGAADGHGGARHRVDVGAEPELIANALALELRGELRQVDREIPVRLVVIHDEKARETLLPLADAFILEVNVPGGYMRVKASGTVSS